MRFVARTTCRAALVLAVLVGTCPVTLWNASLGAQDGAVPSADKPAAPTTAAPDASPDAAKTADAQTPPADKSAPPDETIGELLVKSGPAGITFYGILFVFSLISLTVALERVYNLRRSKILPTTFERALRDMLVEQTATADDFRRLCEGSDSSVSRILRAGVLRAGRPLAEVEKAMEDAAAREMADLRGRNRQLYVLGNVGPLIGLLGTVVGMIFTFRTANKMGLGQGQALSEGIYLALLCTAGGLAIAIPSLLAAALLNTRAERLMREVAERLTETTPSFVRMEVSRTALKDDDFSRTLVDFTVPKGKAS